MNKGLNRVRVRIPSKLSKYFIKYLDTKIIFVIDFVVSLFSSTVIILLLNFFSESKIYQKGFAICWLVSSFFASFAAILVSKNYKVIIRHAQIKDLISLFRIGLIKVVIMGIIVGIVFRIYPTILFALLVDLLLTTFLLIFIRLAMILAYDIYRNLTKDRMSRKRVMIYGTNDKSVATLTRLQDSPHYQIIGFLSPNNGEKGMKVSEQRVYKYETEEEFCEIAKNNSVDYILFGSEKDAKAEKDKLVKYCTQSDIKMLITPGIDEINGEAINRNRLREVKVEDLLGREEIKLSMDDDTHSIHDKTVLVTGAAGSIGSELCRQMARHHVKKLILFDNAETPMHNLRLELEDKFAEQEFVPVIGDVRQEERLDFVFRTFKPEIVFHAAAYKHVPLMEENPCEGVLVNVVGSRHVADKCLQYGTEKMVMISTDKAVNPTNIMGCTKRLAEIYVQSLGLAIEKGTIQGKTRFITTRFGNVLGSNGSVIPRFRDQIASGGPVTVTDPRINRFFMTIPEACRLVMEASTISKGNQICVFDMGEPVKIDDLAKKMIELSGLQIGKDIQIKYTGLRPGEKLYEEVLSNAENTDPTSHDRIRIARVREYDYQDALKAVEALEILSRAVNIPDMVILMKQIVPEFKSQNSKFCIYDK